MDGLFFFWRKREVYELSESSRGRFNFGRRIKDGRDIVRDCCYMSRELYRRRVGLDGIEWKCYIEIDQHLV